LLTHYFCLGTVNYPEIHKEDGCPPPSWIPLTFQITIDTI
jgi:hypothetical protein